MINFPRNQIENLVRDNVKGTAIVSVAIETIPDMRKTGNPYVGKVVKRQILNGVMGYDYEDGVNRLAAKEGKEAREAKPRAWGILSPDRLFVHHKGESYLRMKVQRSIDPAFFNTETGELIDREKLTPFLPVKVKSSTQADLDGEVIERDIKLSSIRVLKFKGQTWNIKDMSTTAIQPESVTSATSVPSVPSVSVDNVKEYNEHSLELPADWLDSFDPLTLD